MHALTMANVYSIAWLVYLCGLYPVLSANSSSGVNYDLSLLFEYRRFIDKYLSNNNCTEDYSTDDTSKPLVLDYQAWEKEENLANNVANYLTSMWRFKNSENFSLVENEPTMYSLVRSNVLFSHQVYGSVICFEGRRFMKRERFCPYAFRDKTAMNRTRVFDLGARYDYLQNKTKFVWWKIGREKGIKNELKSDTEYYDTNLMYVNASDSKGKSGRFFNVTGRIITSNDGLWTTPYYDCYGGKIWMLTYLAPFYDELNRFLGVVSIDIDLDSIEIDQCEYPDKKAIQEAKEQWRNDGRPFSLYGTHRCRPESTECVHERGGGFTNGNYRCVCRKGYYFPAKFNATGIESFEGSEIEYTYSHNKTLYNSMFYCLACAEGCEECVDDSPCMFERNVPLMIALLTLNETIKGLAIALATYIFVFRRRKIIKASSPVFMEIIAMGIILMYFEISLGYLEASVAVCIAKSWLYHVGFILAFGSLLLKTWRVVVIFRLRSAKMIELTDFNLLKYLAVMVASVLIYLMIWTWTSTPAEETIDAHSGYKYRRCVHGWFSNAIVIGEILFLSWGAWLSLRVRNAPSAYNESKYIAWCIYNSVFIMVLASLLRYLFRRNIQNPDVSYMVDFLSTHVVATMMLVFLFISKIFLVKKHSPKTAAPSSLHSASHTEHQKSPFRLNRFADGTFVPEIDEERSVHSFEMEIITLREEIRSLNAQLAVYENKQARHDRRKGSGPDDNDRSLDNGLQNTSPEKETEGRTPGRHRSVAREDSHSLIKNIRNSRTTNSDATYLAVPIKRSVSDEAITTVSSVSQESQE